LAGQGVQRRLARGETLVRAGDRSAPCANLQRGLMKICHTTPAGQEVIVGLLWPGDFIGQSLDGEATHDVVALTPVTLCQFPAPVMARTLAEQPTMERALLTRTLADVRQLRSRLAQLSRATALARVAGFIEETARRLGTEAAADGVGPGMIALPLSRGEMADLLGLTIETVSRQMTKLRSAGVIGLPGGRRVLIRDPDALEQAAEGVA
uniref:Crp/Fnr family transcriptional regulator n=1 Tax=Sandarakinorhabdus rubra TaxID=2672568 RepID=UPI0013DD2DDF